MSCLSFLSCFENNLAGPCTQPVAPGIPTRSYPKHKSKPSHSTPSQTLPSSKYHHCQHRQHISLGYFQIGLILFHSIQHPGAPLGRKQVQVFISCCFQVMSKFFFFFFIQYFRLFFNNPPMVAELVWGFFHSVKFATSLLASLAGGYILLKSIKYVLSLKLVSDSLVFSRIQI